MTTPSISTSPCPECCRYGEHYHLCPRLAAKQAADAKLAKECEAAAKRGVPRETPMQLSPYRHTLGRKALTAATARAVDALINACAAVLPRGQIGGELIAAARRGAVPGLDEASS